MPKTVTDTSSSWLSDFTISTPAAIMLIAYGIMIVTIILPFEIPLYNDETNQYDVIQYNFWQRILLILYLALPVIASVYSVNCMVVGNCNIWSYVVTFVHVLWVSIFIIIAFMYAFGKK